MSRPLPLIPAFLSHLEVDPRRRLPVPSFNMHSTGPDFTALSSDRMERAINNHACGVCDRPLEYWIAFVGGPVSYHSRTYANPPMHRRCAEASLTLCPYISLNRTKRATDNRLMEGATHSTEMTLDKPRAWFVVITRQFTVHTQHSADGAAVRVFRAAPYKDAAAYTYGDDGSLHPAP